MGNICRSPAGEAVLRHLAPHTFEIDSAGTIGYHTGNPPDERMHRAAATRGIATGGAARQITSEDLRTFDLILTMDPDNRAYVDALASKTTDATAKIHDFVEYCTEHDVPEVPDPYYGGAEGFEHVLDLLEDGCAEIIRRHG